MIVGTFFCHWSDPKSGAMWLNLIVVSSEPGSIEKLGFYIFVLDILKDTPGQTYKVGLHNNQVKFMDVKKQEGSEWNKQHLLPLRTGGFHNLRGV